jgi:hypothetical protein
MKKIILACLITFLSSNFYAQTNSLNPYDYAGKIHNDVLDDFLKNHLKPGMNFDQISQITKKLFLENNDFINSFGQNDYSKIEFNINLFNECVKDIPNNCKNVISKYSKSENLNLYLNQFLDDIFRFMGRNNEKELHDYILGFEKTIINSKLTNEEKKQILIATSITRYSNYYWNNTSAMSFKNGWLADAIGGIIGGVVGTILEPGIGSYAGAVIVAGAASGTVEAIKNK